jgi:uncharacterized protein
MTPQEQQLITELFARLKQTRAQAKDADADQLIRKGVIDNPEAPYLLVQTVLIQEMALRQAQDLGDPVSRGGVPLVGPWGRAPQPTAPASPPPAPAAAPGMMSGASSRFLRSAAATALGVVGGQMLFQGIESMFGQHGASILSGQSIQPAPAESSSDDSDAQDTRDDATVADDDPDQDADSASDDSFDDSGSV